MKSNEKCLVVSDFFDSGISVAIRSMRRVKRASEDEECATMREDVEERKFCSNATWSRGIYKVLTVVAIMLIVIVLILPSQSSVDNRATNQESALAQSSAQDPDPYKSGSVMGLDSGNNFRSKFDEQVMDLQWKTNGDRVATWQSVMKYARFPEPAALEIAVNVSNMIHPYSPKLCFKICNKTVHCADEVASNLAKSPRMNPIYHSKDCTLVFPYYATIGWSQSGSTWLFDLLQLHPMITQMDLCAKELHYLDRSVYRQGLSDPSLREPLLGRYFTCFKRLRNFKANKKITGDNTVKMIYADIWMPVWLKAVNPNFKLLLVLRNPSNRVFSRYSMKDSWKHCAGILSMKACRDNFAGYVDAILDHIKKNCPSLKPGGDPSQVYNCARQKSIRHVDSDHVVSTLYGHYLRHWLNFFPPEQILIIFSDDLFLRTTEVANEIAAFLKIGKYPKGLVEKEWDNLRRWNHAKASPPEEAMTKLTEFFHPYMEDLKNLLTSEFGIDKQSIRLEI